MAPTFRVVSTSEATLASDLVQLSFLELAGGDWEPHARQAFLNESAPIALSKALNTAIFAAGAFVESAMVGFVLMPKPSQLSMLFVHPGYLRRGIARQLWDKAHSHVETNFPEIKTIELNATPYAVNFYRSVGFVPIAAEFTVDGCRATRMACGLPARGLNATAP